MMSEKATDLTSLIAGIRNHKGQEDEYIGTCLREIRRDIQSGNRSDKSEAVLKLWYLSLLGYNTASWSSFAIIEVMTHSVFLLKRPGFFACATSFNDDTAVALLTINLFKKELSQSIDIKSVCLTLSCLASMVTQDIARDLHSDVLLLLSSSKPQIRRQACLCLFKMFMKYPPALLTCYPKIKDLLNDSNVSVVSAAVSTILELAMRNPKNYIRLAPVLHKLLSPPLSNWVSLKILKIFRLLCPLEPRLPPKLHSALLDFLQSDNTARSVELEVLCLVVHCLPPTLDIDRMALERLKTRYIASTDINLKCIGLRLLAEATEVSDGMLNLVQSTFGNVLLEEILKFVSSPDPLIRSSALRVMERAVSIENFPSAAESLISLSRESPNEAPEYIATLLGLGGRDNFSFIEDFQAYLHLLVIVSRTPLPYSTRCVIGTQLIQLGQSVPSLRAFLLRAVAILLWPEPCVHDDQVSQPFFPFRFPINRQPLSSDSEAMTIQQQSESHTDSVNLQSETLPSKKQFDLNRHQTSTTPESIAIDTLPLDTPDIHTISNCIKPSIDIPEEAGLYAATSLPGDALWVSSETLIAVIQMIGVHSSVLLDEFNDSDDIASLSQLYSHSFSNCQSHPPSIALLSNALLRDKHKSSTRTFPLLIEQQLIIVALQPHLDMQLRSHAALTVIRLLEPLRQFVHNNIIHSLLDQLQMIQSSFLSSSASPLFIIGRLLSSIIIRIDNTKIDTQSTLSLLSVFHTERVKEEASTREKQMISPPEDLSIPFFDAIEATAFQRAKRTNKIGDKEITLTAVDGLDEVPKKKHTVIKPCKDGDGAGMKRTDYQQKTQQEKRSSIKLWEKILDDGLIAVYVCVIGREEKFGMQGENLIDNNLVHIGVDCRCENLRNGEILKNVRLWQESSLGIPKSHVPVLISDRLEQRSKKSHLTLIASIDSLLYGSTTSYSDVRISYEIDNLNDNSKNETISPLMHSAQISMRISLILQPLALDDDGATLLMKMHQQSLNCKATISQDYLLNSISNPLTSLDQILENLKSRITRAAQLTNLHPLFRIAGTSVQSSTSTVVRPPSSLESISSTTESLQENSIGRLTCLLIGRLWNQDSETLGGLIIQQSILPMNVIVGFISCNVKFDQGVIQLIITFRSNNHQISGQCVSTLLFYLNETLIGRLAVL